MKYSFKLVKRGILDGSSQQLNIIYSATFLQQPLLGTYKGGYCRKVHCYRGLTYTKMALREIIKVAVTGRWLLLKGGR